MALKSCKICKKMFNASGSTIYCSNDCKEQGKKNSRKAWENRTGYKEKKNEWIRNYRAKKTEEMDDIREQNRQAVKEAREQWAAEMRASREAERQAKIAAGDLNALMDEAQRTRNHIEYWRLYKLTELERVEAWIEQGFKPYTVIVNDIDIHHDDFEQLAAESVNELGYIHTVRK